MKSASGATALNRRNMKEGVNQLGVTITAIGMATLASSLCQPNVIQRQVGKSAFFRQTRSMHLAIIASGLAIILLFRHRIYGDALRKEVSLYHHLEVHPAWKCCAQTALGAQHFHGLIFVLLYTVSNCHAYMVKKY